MIPHGVELFVAREPVNIRLSFDRLAGLAETITGRPARSRALFVFFGKRGDAIKVLHADETGLCTFYKRLDRGRFQIPEVELGQDSVEISESELDGLLEGLALESRSPHNPPYRFSTITSDRNVRSQPRGDPRSRSCQAYW